MLSVVTFYYYLRMVAHLGTQVFQGFASAMERTLEVNTSGLTTVFGRNELHDMHSVSVIDVRVMAAAIQKDLRELNMLRNMARLSPFINAMEEFEEVVDLFMNARTVTGFVWGAMRFILQVIKSLHFL